MRNSRATAGVGEGMMATASKSDEGREEPQYFQPSTQGANHEHHQETCCDRIAVAALVTTGCASLSIEGDSVSGNPNYLGSPDDNVAIHQMKESSYLGGE